MTCENINASGVDLPEEDELVKNMASSIVWKFKSLFRGKALQKLENSTHATCKVTQSKSADCSRLAATVRIALS